MKHFTSKKVEIQASLAMVRVGGFFSLDWD